MAITEDLEFRDVAYPARVVVEPDDEQLPLRADIQQQHRVARDGSGGSAHTSTSGRPQRVEGEDWEGGGVL